MHQLSVLILLSLFSFNTYAEDGLSMSVATTVGSDSDIYEDDTKESDTFYKINPKLGFKHSGFSGEIGVALKDWSDSLNSDQARNSEVTAKLGFAGTYDKFSSNTEGSIGFESDRDQAPNAPGDPTGVGERVTKFSAKQGLSYDFGQMDAGVTASIDREDSDEIQVSSPDLIEDRSYTSSFTSFKVAFNLGIDFSEMVSLKVEPSITNKTYDDEPGRLTNGDGGIGALDADREYLDNKIATSLPITFGNFSVKPKLSLGTRSDRAFGGEDNSSTGYGIEASFKIPQAYDLALSFSYDYANTSFDQWTALNQAVTTGETREDDEYTLKLGASIQFNPIFSFAFNYKSYEIESNRNFGFMNYVQNITTGTLTAVF